MRVSFQYKKKRWKTLVLATICQRNRVELDLAALLQQLAGFAFVQIELLCGFLKRSLQVLAITLLAQEVLQTLPCFALPQFFQ